MKTAKTCKSCKDKPAHEDGICKDCNLTEQQKADIQSVLAMLNGDTDRKKIANYIKEHIYNPY